MNLKDLNRRPKRSLAKFIFIPVLVLILIASAAGYYFFYHKQPESKNNSTSNVAITQTPKPTPTPDPLPSTLRVNTLWFGDVFWGRYVNDWSMKSPLKEAYPFSGAHTLEREKYNAWIGSLDCPVTDKIIDSATMDSNLLFNCTPNYLPEAAKWYTVFGLANSHTANMGGLTGFATTKQYLSQYNIQYFGHYEKSYLNELCSVVSLDTFETYSDEKYTPKKEYKMPIVICGYHDTFSLPTDEQLAVITEYSKYFPTFIMGNQGTEYNTTPDALQQKVFRKMIDLGGDGIIGISAHVVQSSESYKGKLIFYSMGNFIFDQQAGEIVRSGAAVNADMTFTYDENLAKYSVLAEKCGVHPNTCLADAKEQNLVKPKFKIKYDIVPTDNSNKLMKKADQKISDIVLKRANWANVQPQLLTEL